MCGVNLYNFNGIYIRRESRVGLSYATESDYGASIQDDHDSLDPTALKRFLESERSEGCTLIQTSLHFIILLMIGSEDNDASFAGYMQVKWPRELVERVIELIEIIESNRAGTDAVRSSVSIKISDRVLGCAERMEVERDMICFMIFALKLFCCFSFLGCFMYNGSLAGRVGD